LTGIDAPEKNQPYGLASSYKLSEMLINKWVLLKSKPDNGNLYSIDRYNRVLAKVILDGRDINLAQAIKWVCLAFQKISKTTKLIR
jgi:endonuclease YncB( thermonuclease family)